MPTLLGMGISQSLEGPNRTERQRKGDALTIEVQGSWDIRLWDFSLTLRVIPLAFLVLQLVDGRVGLISFHNCVSVFL